MEGNPVDATELLAHQHREVDQAFEEFAATTDPERRKEIARQVIHDLSVHAGIEEVAFYPTVKDALPELASEIEHDLEEHAEAKQLLGELQGMDPGQQEFDTTFRQLVSDVRDHVEEEEINLFPKVRDALTGQELSDLGDAMQELQSKVPTRPHPRAPQEPPANKALGPAVGALDRLRDGIRERVGKRDV
jgi:hemerythrin superfamily protein